MVNPLVVAVFAAAFVAAGSAAAAPGAPTDRPILPVARFSIDCDIQRPKLKPVDVAPDLIGFLRTAPFNFPQVSESDADFYGVLLSWDAPPLPERIEPSRVPLLSLQLSGNILIMPGGGLITTADGRIISADGVSVSALFPTNLASSGQPLRTLDPSDVADKLKARLEEKWRPDVKCKAQRDTASASTQIPQYLGEVRLFAFYDCPKGWVPADGQLLPISKNQPLFHLLGTGYGGDGKQTFGLPDFSKQAPAGTGNQRGPIWCIATSGLDPQKPPPSWSLFPQVP